MTQVLGIAVLVGSGVTAGVLFCVALSVVPALLAMSPERYIQAHRLLGRNYDPAMPLIVVATTLLDAVLSVQSGQPQAHVLFAAAAVLLFGVSVVSHLCNVPINRRVKALAGPVPPDWQDPRKVWRNWHLLRTALAGLALVANSAAIVLPR